MTIEMGSVASHFVAYLVGFLCGFVVNRALLGKFRITTDWIAGAITIVWCISILVEIINQSYVTSPYLHGIMGLVAGYFYKRKDV